MVEVVCAIQIFVDGLRVNRLGFTIFVVECWLIKCVDHVFGIIAFGYGQWNLDNTAPLMVEQLARIEKFVRIGAVLFANCDDALFWIRHIFCLGSSINNLTIFIKFVNWCLWLKEVSRFENLIGFFDRLILVVRTQIQGNVAPSVSGIMLVMDPTGRNEEGRKSHGIGK